MLVRAVSSSNSPKFIKIYPFLLYHTHALPFSNIPWPLKITKIAQAVFQKKLGVEVALGLLGAQFIRVF